MVYIIDASSLRNTIQGLPYQQKRPLFGSFYNLGGLSFNTRNPIEHKVLQSYLDAGGALERTKKLVIWHDVINNTLTPHKKTEACPISDYYQFSKSTKPVSKPLYTFNVLELLRLSAS